MKFKMIGLLLAFGTLLNVAHAAEPAAKSSLIEAKAALKEVILDNDEARKYKIFIDLVNLFYAENVVTLTEKTSPEVVAEATAYKELLAIFLKTVGEDQAIQDAGVERFKNTTEESVIPGFKKGFAFSHNQKINAYWIGRATSLSASMDKFIQAGK